MMARPLLYFTPGALPAPCPASVSVLQRYQLVELGHRNGDNGDLHLQDVRGEPAVAVAVVAPVEDMGVLAALRKAAPTLFLIARHQHATEDAQMRWAAFAAGANMVTHTQSPGDLLEALDRVAGQQLEGHLTCDWCGLPGLTPEGYYHHQPLFHIHHPNLGGTCQICHKHVSIIVRHLHDEHAPPGGPPPEIRTGVFALVVVRRPSDGRFLATQEFAGAGFWIPGGGVDPGESLSQGAVRECKEEAGVDVQLKALLHVQAARDSSWRRVIFYAEPCDEGQTPKTLPDFESAGACWVGAEEVGRLKWRSEYETGWLLHVARGGEVGPLAMPEEWAATFADVRL